MLVVKVSFWLMALMFKLNNRTNNRFSC